MKNLKSLLKHEKKYDLKEQEQKILNDPRFKNFCKGLPVEDYLVEVNKYIEEEQLCIGCKSLADCKQYSKGMQPTLSKSESGEINLNYQSCQFNNANKNSYIKNIKCFHIPTNVLTTTFADVHNKEGRADILDYAKKFINEHSVDNPMRGMYLHGMNGVGKTFILIALANELAKKGNGVVLAYYPDLVRNLKGSITDNSLEGKVEELKSVDILILDDIGAERVTPFIRDEVFGPIVQYRLLGKKPTFFTSNYTLKELNDRLAGDNNDKSNAMRVVKRIYDLCEIKGIS